MDRQTLAPLILVLSMLSLAKLALGQDDYYLGSATEDYYVNGGEPQGVWLPTAGARALGLSGPAAKEDFHALFHGRQPDGTLLVQNADKPKRCPGWDLCFSVPKSVSVAWFMAPPEIRHVFQQCQFEAVAEAIRYLEREAAFSRRGKGGSQLVRARLVGAAFEHGTSRTLEAQLHTHATIDNIAVREDGSTGALESRPLYQHSLRAGRIYAARLAGLLQERLGLKITPSAASFELVGVPQPVCNALSTRANQIKQSLREKGLHTPAAAAIAALETREAKQAGLTRPELFARWQRIAAEFGFTPEHACRLFFKARPKNTPAQAARVADQAIDSMAERYTVFDRNAVLCTALHAAVEYGVHPTLVISAVDKRLRQRRDLGRVPGTDHNPRYTTRDATIQRQDIARFVKRLTSSEVRPASPELTDRVIRHHSAAREYVSEELKYHVGQIVRAAVGKDTKRINRDLLARQAELTLTDSDKAAIRETATSTDRIKVLNRLPPDHQNLTLSCLRQIWQAQGYTVIGTSLSKAATMRLEEETGIESATLRKLELRINPTPGFVARFCVRQMYRAAAHKTTYSLDRLKIDSKTVLVVDGADRLTFAQMAFLTRSVAEQGGQLVLVQSPGKRPNGPAPTPLDCVLQQLRQAQPDRRPTQRDVPRQRPDQSIDRNISL